MQNPDKKKPKKNPPKPKKSNASTSKNDYTTNTFTNATEQNEKYLKSPDGKNQISQKNFIFKHSKQDTLDVINSSFLFKLCYMCRFLLKWQKQYDESEDKEDKEDRLKESSYYYSRLFEIADGKGVKEKGWSCKESVEAIKDNLKIHAGVLKEEIMKSDDKINEDILLELFGNSKDKDELFNVHPEYFWKNKKITRKRKIAVIKQIAEICLIADSKSFDDSEMSKKTQQAAINMMMSQKPGEKINPIKERFVVCF